ncbi:MAG TPA: hypothetical protein VET85_07415 [Stellaceae bacterium]|nr:hypothetical protein [Stellaceae bacterium]
MTGLRRTIGRYLAMVIAVVVAVVGLCLVLNILVDPLWYFRANVLTGVSYAFNERLAKVDRFLPRMAEYDCIILGSSTAALVPERMISGYHCFNMGFSGGRVSEVLLYGKYLRARGFAPKLLIVGVDKFNFDGPDLKPDVPDFIRDNRDPPPFWQSYLSLDALGFSIRTLRGDYPNHRTFDEEFRSHIIARRKPYVPPQVGPRDDPGEYHPERAEMYVAVRRLFPEARAIGFVAPTRAWTFAQLKVDGWLDLYLGAIRQIAPAYDEFIDFAVPSEITMSTTNTYDGIHYVDAVNDRIAAVLVSGKPPPGVDWHTTSFDAIAAAYQNGSARLVGQAKAATPSSSE